MNYAPRIRLATNACILFGTLICFNVFAQVSRSEGLSPIEGVVIPKALSSEPQVIKPGAVFKDCDQCPEMVVIPAGSFLMGSPPDPKQDPFSNVNPEKIIDDDEMPQHRVSIQSFSIGKYEVTQEQWYAVMGKNPSSDKGRTLPVANISWDEAQVFVQKLSQKTGKSYRLPSEAEWEYAARGGNATTYPWGDSAAYLYDYAWTFENSNELKSVGLKKPNQFGIYDMLGNVSEWTQDCKTANYSGSPTDGSAWTKGNCDWRVVRGGSFKGLGKESRPASRHATLPEWRFFFQGLRIARDL